MVIGYENLNRVSQCTKQEKEVEPVRISAESRKEFFRYIVYENDLSRAEESSVTSIR